MIQHTTLMKESIDVDNLNSVKRILEYSKFEERTEKLVNREPFDVCESFLNVSDIETNRQDGVCAF